MKQKGMLTISLRGINFGFWSRLGCSAQSPNILSCHLRYRLGFWLGLGLGFRVRVRVKDKSNFLFPSFVFSSLF